MVRTYRDLIVWQKSIELVIEIYKITRKFPKQEIYGLVNQIRRAVVGIPSNIAEGQGRGHLAEYVQFLRIAYGSAAEVETQLLISHKIDYINQNEYRRILGLLYEIMKMLNSLLLKLKPNT